jgi:CheY-like chemotaxis protein
VSLDSDNVHGLTVIEACRLGGHAEADQVLLAESTRLLAREYGPLVEVGQQHLKGLPEPTRIWSVPWSADGRRQLRAVIADDAALMREGIALVLERAGIEVVGQAADADQLLRLMETQRPDLAIVDIHMPPTHRTEGLDAAIRIRESFPHTGVLLLSADVEPRYAQRLLAVAETGVGYLLKERVSDLSEFAEAARRVATGGAAFEMSLVSP